jgi:hypothetical protein
MHVGGYIEVAGSFEDFPNGNVYYHEFCSNTYSTA